MKALLSYDRLSNRKVIFFFLLSVNFFKATAIEAQPPVQNPQAVIYISGNAQIHGNLNNSAVIINSNNEVPMVRDVHHKVKKQPNQIELASVNKKKSYKELASKIASIKKTVFYSSTTRCNLKDSSLFSIGNSALSINVYPTLKYASTKISEVRLAINCSSQLRKQNYYTSLSYLQFGKYRSSSLRGPPVLNYQV